MKLCVVCNAHFGNEIDFPSADPICQGCWDRGNRMAKVAVAPPTPAPSYVLCPPIPGWQVALDEYKAKLDARMDAIEDRLRKQPPPPPPLAKRLCQLELATANPFDPKTAPPLDTSWTSAQVTVSVDKNEVEEWRQKFKLADRDRANYKVAAEEMGVQYRAARDDLTKATATCADLRDQLAASQGQVNALMELREHLPSLDLANVEPLPISLAQSMMNFLSLADPSFMKSAAPAAYYYRVGERTIYIAVRPVLPPDAVAKP